MAALANTLRHGHPRDRRGRTRRQEMSTGSTDGIADADGLRGAAFAFLWLETGGAAGDDIAGAIGSSYTLAKSDEGQ